MFTQDSSVALSNKAGVRCRKLYLRIHRLTWKSGIDKQKVVESKNNYSFTEGLRSYVKAEASEPTGVVLGHPLPDRNLPGRLWHISRLVERRLDALGTRPTFAYVSAPSYHLTIYSRSHFERGPVFHMNQPEKEQAERIISAARIGPITVELNGFLLAPDGRLLARGYPQDERLFQLRQLLAAELPKDGGNPSPLAPIKLGHFLVCPPLPQIRELLDWLGRCCHHLSTRVVFEDVYTPSGRIRL
jgi:hypothetical protein